MINLENIPIDVSQLLESLKTTIADLQLQVAIKDCVNQALIQKLEMFEKPEELEKLEKLMDSEGDTDEQDKV